MLSELEEYAHKTPEPQDSESILQTVAFLKACNSLFERGILGKKVFIKSMDSLIIASMDRRFRFFEEWLDEHLAEGISDCTTCKCLYMYIYLHPGYTITTTTWRPFLSWQTWDLLRVMYYGFQGFCAEFLQKHPG